MARTGRSRQRKSRLVGGQRQGLGSSNLCSSRVEERIEVRKLACLGSSIGLKRKGGERGVRIRVGERVGRHGRKTGWRSTGNAWGSVGGRGSAGRIGMLVTGRLRLATVSSVDKVNDAGDNDARDDGRRTQAHRRRVHLHHMESTTLILYVGVPRGRRGHLFRGAASHVDGV